MTIFLEIFDILVKAMFMPCQKRMTLTQKFEESYSRLQKHHSRNFRLSFIMVLKLDNFNNTDPAVLITMSAVLFSSPAAKESSYS